MNISFLAGLAGNSDQPWSDVSYEQGTGGSEECLVLLARELARLGHRVRVFNHCNGVAGIWPYGESTVEYLDAERYGCFGEDLLVSWRQPHLLEHAQAKQRWDWDHNNALGIHVPTKYQLQFIDKMVFLNPWHLEQYVRVGVPRDKCWVGGTAVDLAVFEQSVERIPGRCIAFFHPKRGLAELRRHWVKVKERVPWATLAQFWWEDEMFADYPPDERLGILPMRHLGPREIAAEILRSECFAYPATGTETAPLTVIKAQAGGAIPVVVPVGGIHETLAGQGVETSHAYFAGDLANLLADTMRQQILRGEMMAKTRQKYSWAEVAKRWTAELEKELKEHS